MNDLFIIKLENSRKPCLINIEHAELVKNKKWYSVGTGYAATYQSLPNKKFKTIYMHKLLLEDNKLKVDHINGFKSDNRIKNLRYVSHSLNIYLAKKRPGCSSRYKGVNWSKSCSSWQASITINKKRIYLGTFIDDIDAALAYDKKAKELYGNLATLNFRIIKPK